MDEKDIIGYEDAKSVLSQDSIKLQSDIIQEQDQDKLRDLTHLFNLVQAKKNVLRASQLDGIYDKMLSEVQRRLANGKFEDNDDFMNAWKLVEGALNRAEAKVNLVDETPAITLLQQNNTVNVGSVESLTKESRDRIMKAIQGVINAKEDIVVEGDNNANE